MRTEIINGDLAYIFESPQGHFIPMNERIDDSKVQIIRHRDLVRMINKLFKEIAKNENKEAKYAMFQLLNMFAGTYAGSWRIPMEVKEKSVVFDDFQKVKKKREPRLCAETSITKNRNEGAAVREIGKFKVYRGGALKGF